MQSPVDSDSTEVRGRSPLKESKRKGTLVTHYDGEWGALKEVKHVYTWSGEDGGDDFYRIEFDLEQWKSYYSCFQDLNTKLEGRLIPKEFYQPTYDTSAINHNLAYLPLTKNQFFKTASPLKRSLKWYDNDDRKVWPAQELLDEIIIMERLQQSPHPHIVEYHGVVVSGTRICGIVLEKLDITLEEAQKKPRASHHIYDVERVMREVRSAVGHLHNIGIMHGDIHPSNVCLDENGRTVLIDFDSAFPLGAERYGTGMHAECVEFQTKLSKELPPELLQHGDPHYPIKACKEFDLACLDWLEKWFEENPQVSIVTPSE